MKVRLFSALVVACFVVLGTAGTASAAPSQLGATLLGTNEVENPGAADAGGSAVVEIDPETGQVCFEISLINLENVTAAHIHVGGAGSNGGVVVNLDWATTNGSGCVTADSPTLVAITSNPSLYYVNVHTDVFPNGAVRGQLAPSAAAPIEAPSELAFTGSSTTGMLAAAGAALVATGAAVVRVATADKRR